MKQSKPVNLKPLVIVIDGKSLELHQIFSNGQIEYSLNDLHKFSGAPAGKRPSTYIDNLSDFKCSSYCIKKIRGKQGGTYANEMGVYWYASKISEQFEVAVFQAFHAVANGQTEKAVDLVASVVPNELISQAHEASKQINQLIALWDQKQLKPRGSRAHIIIWDHIVCKTTTGGSIKSIKDAHGVNSLAEYFEKINNKKGLGAYLALSNMLIPLLENGIDYYLLKKIFTENHLKLAK